MIFRRKKQSKFKSQKINGYDSKKEAFYASQLKLLLQQGEIRDYEEQKVFELLPK